MTRGDRVVVREIAQVSAGARPAKRASALESEPGPLVSANDAKRTLTSIHLRGHGLDLYLQLRSGQPPNDKECSARFVITH